MEDEKVTPLGLTDQLPSAQGLLQATPTPAPFSLSQVWNPKLVSLLSWSISSLMDTNFKLNLCVYSSQHRYLILGLMLLSIKSSVVSGCKCIFRGMVLSIYSSASCLNLCDMLTLFFYCRAVPIAMDRAIKEIVSSIVQRSVSIATQTTKELVLKVDISYFPDFILT